MDLLVNGHRVVSWRPSRGVAGATEGECAKCGQRVIQSRAGVVFGLSAPCGGNDWHRPAVSTRTPNYFRGD